jgi:hypothetical protein
MNLMVAQLKVGLLILGLTLLSGLADSLGFLHAALIWQDRKPIWAEIAKSALGFGSGILLYWITLRYLKEVQIAEPEVQTLIWFGVTMVGVALLSGKFAQWRILDQFAAIIVLAGIGWLLFRTSG